MVSIKEISKSELRPLVLKSYENDEDLFNQYHVGKYNLNECVEKTIEMIDEVAAERKLTYYKAVYGGVDIGYMVILDNMLYSFAIAMGYRKKDILIEWWDKLSEMLGDCFFTMIYRNNVRASEFLKRQKMKVIMESIEDNYLIFSNN